MFRSRKRIAIILHDVLMIPVAWYLAYWLRFNLHTIPGEFMQTATLLLPVIIVCQLSGYIVFGLYRGIWRFASLPDFVRIGKSIFLGVLITTLLVFLTTRMEAVPRSVIPLYAILLFVLLGGNRILYRYLKDHRVEFSSGKRVLVVGAGEAAGRLLRDMLRHRRAQYMPVGMVDDDPDKTGQEIHGVRVLGAFDEIPEIVNKYAIDLVVIAIPSLSSARMQRLVTICESADVKFKTLPRLEDLISGQVSVNAIQAVSIEDLLGREKVELDRDMIQSGLSGKIIMVTGGGGSIGTELCKQVVDFVPEALIIYERSEFNLYRIQRELMEKNPQVKLVPVLGDVCDQRAVENVISVYRPDMIFHAASHKHVSFLQSHPREAAKNNILGAMITARTASKFHCDTFVFISTDKAVDPANILGLTKRAGEMYCESMNAVSTTRFITVRFGNVLGSDGSVVPLFREQIQAGGPVTVTHPDITRYFMTITEACQLILQASVVEGERGIFVLDMGAPVRIKYLAEQMIRLSGKEPGEDIEIQYIGLRAGEKLQEALFYDNEEKEQTRNAKILRARHAPYDWNRVRQSIDRLEHSLTHADDNEIRAILAALISDNHDETANVLAGTVRMVDA